MLYDVKSVLQDSEKRTVTTMAMIAGETGTSLANGYKMLHEPKAKDFYVKKNSITDNGATTIAKQHLIHTSKSSPSLTIRKRTLLVNYIS